MSGRRAAGLLFGFLGFGAFTAALLADLVKGSALPVVGLLFVYSVLCLHFLARIASRRHRQYVLRWRQLVVWLYLLGPAGVAIGGLVSGSGYRGIWPVLFGLVSAGSVGMWVALRQLEA